MWGYTQSQTIESTEASHTPRLYYSIINAPTILLLSHNPMEQNVYGMSGGEEDRRSLCHHAENTVMIWFIIDAKPLTACWLSFVQIWVACLLSLIKNKFDWTFLFLTSDVWVDFRRGAVFQVQIYQITLFSTNNIHHLVFVANGTLSR